MMMRSFIALFALTASGCLMEHGYKCKGGAVRGGPDELCTCPDGREPEGKHCLDAGTEADADSNVLPEDDAQMPDGGDLEDALGDAGSEDGDVTECEPVTEICNGLDDDCDDIIDNGDAKNECGGPCSMVLAHDVGTACNNGLKGVCAASGNWRCSDSVASGMVCDAPVIIPATADTCNGKDDNCDGEVDEINIGTDTYRITCPGVPVRMVQACTKPPPPNEECSVIRISS
jgi:hypothetical protein